jgi:ribosome-associated toxin RatA of RatAB toxin-antitoxin module
VAIFEESIFGVRNMPNSIAVRLVVSIHNTYELNSKIWKALIVCIFVIVAHSVINKFRKEINLEIHFIPSFHI